MGTGSADEHFIPISQRILLETLLSDEQMGEEDKVHFKRFYDILKSLFHFEFQAMHESLKDNYHAFDPDPVTPPPHLDDTMGAINAFNSSFSTLMERANFTALSKKDLEDAFAQDTPMAVNVDVDLDRYTMLNLYSRGRTKREETVPFLYIMKKHFEMDVYERLVLVAKFAPKKKRFGRGGKTTLGYEIEEEKIYLKYFKNVPVPDIEMIFPDPKIKMTLYDKLKISIPILTALAVAGSKLASLAGGDTSQSLLTGLIVAFGGYAVKSIISYRNTVMRYIKNITQGLYFKNLDNNAGVFNAVMGEAEEEEVKEAMLAYYFLKNLGPMDEQALDKIVEDWFREKLSIDLDFEVDDALRKLERLRLASSGGEGIWTVLSLEDSLKRLDYIWDNFFDYNKVEGPNEVQITEYKAE